MLLGDNGYPCLHYLLTPLLQPYTRVEVKYNDSHKNTRNILERVFGWWKRKFACLYYGLTVKL